MDNQFFKQKILFPNDDNTYKQLFDMNIRSIYNDEDYNGKFHRSQSYESTPHCGLDRFSTVLLSKSEVNNTHDINGFNNELYSYPSPTKHKSDDSLDMIDKNSMTISFFRDLKDYFTQNMFDQLRKCVNEIYQKDINHFKISSNDFITLTPDELRDRALILKKCISSTDINIVQIYLALRERYKIIESGSIPSIGSLLHTYGYCKPCVFANKKSNYCKSGFGCNFCHYNHKGSKSKNAAKSSFGRLSSQREFFNKIMRIPSSEESMTQRSNATEETFSITSSSTSLLSINELKGPSNRDDYCTYLTSYSNPQICQKNGNGILNF